MDELGQGRSVEAAFSKDQITYASPLPKFEPLEKRDILWRRKNINFHLRFMIR